MERRWVGEEVEGVGGSGGGSRRTSGLGTDGEKDPGVDFRHTKLQTGDRIGSPDEYPES